MTIYDDLMRGDFGPARPEKGPPLPEILKIEWPPGVEEAIMKLPFRAQRYALSTLISGRASPQQALAWTEKWMKGVMF